MKILLLVFALVCTSFAGAKTYSLTLRDDTNIGASRLKGGVYKLELKGDRILLSDGTKSDEFPVRVENEPQKNINTTVTYLSEGGSSRVAEIHLRGTNVKLVPTN